MQAASHSSPPPHSLEMQRFHTDTVPTLQGAVLSHSTETNPEPPLLMDFRINLDLKSTGKTSLFLPITGAKKVNGKRRPQHKRPDGRNCV